MIHLSIFYIILSSKLWFEWKNRFKIFFGIKEPGTVVMLLTLADAFLVSWMCSKGYISYILVRASRRSDVSEQLL